MNWKEITFNQVAAAVLMAVILFLLAFNKGMSEQVVTALIATLSLCGGFLFGSTVGSQAKDKALANSTPITTEVNKP